MHVLGRGDAGANILARQLPPSDHPGGRQRLDFPLFRQPAVRHRPVDETRRPVAAELRLRAVGLEKAGEDLHVGQQVGLLREDQAVRPDGEPSVAERAGEMGRLAGRDHFVEAPVKGVDADEVVAASRKFDK